MTDNSRIHVLDELDWVDVTVEPHHVEQFRNRALRVYEATIPPGKATEYHRHTRDTIYVITAGGRFRSDEPGNQASRTRLGCSTPLLRQVWLLLTRKLGGGWVRMPTGTLIAQPHRTYPLIHRVIAHRSNSAPIRMVGVELQTSQHRPARLPITAGMRDEHSSSVWPAYRLHRPTADHTHLLFLRGGGVLVVVAGAAAINVGEVRTIEAGQAHWLAPGHNTIHVRAEDFDAVLVPAYSEGDHHENGPI